MKPLCFILFLMTILISCNEDKKDPVVVTPDDPGDDIIQTMSLINQSVPDFGENFNISTAIELTFSENIDESSIIVNDEVTSLNTIVLEDSDGVSLPIEYIFGNETNHLFILPESVLNRGRSYKLTVWTTLTSVKGNMLDQTIVINFNTEERTPGQIYNFSGAAGVRWDTPEKHEATSYYEIAVSDQSRRQNGVDPNYTDPNNAYDNVLRCNKSDVVSEGVVIDEETGNSLYGYHCPLDIEFIGENKKYISIRTCYDQGCSAWGYEVTAYADHQEKIIQELTPLIFLDEGNTTCY